ncbi:MAG TPA: NAD(P)(+) transhydrogenase (Re/Si-specific) subunit beta [Candidatus Marinimicrobia bacterium]|jgi:NAD(P) transhydrogenase subunit beta|nr:NAD synthetase [Candidatus Neomarinimicrobiota bacterium]MDP6142629.1 NAD(P)(+) transhydrogenase (Re/Si-specific) subunit beta [Candidatus Neomarinimicrobiota bacterium]MDP6261113.1 NAD(P)(+) transhydrogenase (Re/Si-specific) subunit beta [Candidatus Neomarinimicrobiota bacterium]MDP7127155.1 NAD(P)(+) transhydrogenase (Re/Si-specific) subunit beta [Candidatus Neomarinimicrobiota bacterium]MDP7336555.1 NAD(P)(+) transhydrogenase (Re/Si-specific) subunit beta [Candidatus Neomarinimicrobiota b|tara:strand:+ start:7007 stop:8422 length:1416 start_codon:yes stop_codon:yes gene_type:complete
MKENLILIAYIISAILFIIGIKRLGKVDTARQGNFLSAVGMLIAIIATLFMMDAIPLEWVLTGIAIGAIIGAVSATKVAMTAMPEMVAIFNGFGGGASALVASAEFFKIHGGSAANNDTTTLITIMLSVIIGSLTFTGSFIAWGKLQGKISGQPITYPGQNMVNGLILVGMVIFGYLAVTNMSGFVAETTEINMLWFSVVIVIGLFLGILSVLPIGGADMPVVISLLNSYSGIAAAMTGFVLQNHALIVSGCLVGASGLFLTNIMCKGMNRSLGNVLFSAFGKVDESAVQKTTSGVTVKEMSPDNAAYTMQAAESVIIVPGYGMAVAQAQHEVRKLSDELEKTGVDVKFAVHPVAGRMPGHMNVLLAEANISYDKLFDMDEINDDFASTDVALIIGANDVVNPAARHDESSPIYGMPILNVDQAKTTFVLKRSMNPGFAGISNELFGYENNYMVFGDAKATVSQFVETLKE